MIAQRFDHLSWELIHSLDKKSVDVFIWITVASMCYCWLQTLKDNGITGDIHVIITGLANTYTSYVTTPEEYSVQRYEGASTIYGPYTLLAYIKEFNKLAAALAKVT